MIEFEHYTYRVIWSEEDQEYVGLCAEFPSLSFLDENQLDALRGIVNLVCTVIQDMKKNGEPIPELLSTKKYSGKFVVRTTPEIHRLLSIKAAESEVSLNRYVNSKLIL